MTWHGKRYQHQLAAKGIRTKEQNIIFNQVITEIYQKDNIITIQLWHNNNHIGTGQFIEQNDNIYTAPGSIIYIHPDYRRMGLATLIFKTIEKRTNKKIIPSKTRTGFGESFVKSYFKEGE